MDDNIWGTFDDHRHSGMVWHLEEDQDLSIYGNTFSNFRSIKHLTSNWDLYFSDLRLVPKIY